MQEIENHEPSDETKLYISAITYKHSIDTCWLEDFQQNLTQKERVQQADLNLPARGRNFRLFFSILLVSRRSPAG